MSKNLGLIGVGNMGRSLLDRIWASGVISPEQTLLADHSQEALAPYRDRGAQVVGVQEAARADLLLLCVKPYQVPDLLGSIKPQAGSVVISVAAGVTLSQLREGLGSEVWIVRSMPNTPALVGQGATALTTGVDLPSELRDQVTQVFSAVGQVWWVEEGMMDAVTSISGSGPAYVLLFLEALTDAGVREGLPRVLASQLALQTLKGAAYWAQETGEHPAVLRGLVTTPAGTTIQALERLESLGLRGAVFEAVRAARQRSQEMAGEGKR